MQVQPYLFFEGRCDEAVAFYRQALGAELRFVMRFKDNPEQGAAGPSPGNDDKVMHASVRIGETEIMMSDGRCGGAASFQGFSLSIAAADDSEADRLFNALADGGTITMPLAKTFFASSFGMLTDRFGVGWMVMAGGEAP